MKRYYKKIVFILCFTVMYFGCSDTKVPNRNLRPEQNKNHIISLAELYSYIKEYSPFLNDGILNNLNEKYFELSNKIMYESDKYKIYTYFEELLAVINDGHSAVFYEKGSNSPFYFLPAGADYADGKYYLSYKENNIEIPLGSELIKINDEDVKKYLLNNIAKYIPVKTPHAFENSMIKRLLYSSQNKKIKFTFVVDKNEVNLELKYSIPSEKIGNIKFNKIPDYYDKLNKIYSSHNFSIYNIKEKYSLIQIHNFLDYHIIDEFIEKIIPLIENSAHLILDIRKNSGGNSSIGFAIIKILTGKTDTEISSIDIKNFQRQLTPFLITLAAIKDKNLKAVNHDTLKKLSPFIKDGRVMKTHQLLMPVKEDEILQQIDDFFMKNNEMEELEKKLVFAANKCKIENKNITVFTSYKSGSACDDFACFCKELNIRLIGTHTKGATGNIGIFNLTNNFSFSISLQKTMYNGMAINNKGVSPDIFIIDTIEDIKNQNDPCLHFVLEGGY
nr:S41 family peptidase [Treponema sp. OMZ 799]